jgi:hypothetical protein
MLRVIYRREFHIYLTALYAPETRQAYFDAPPTGGPRCVCLLRAVQYLK